MKMENTPASQPVSSPQPRAGRLLSGLVLLVIGAVMIPTITLTAIGIVVCIAGAVLIGFAFLRRKEETSPTAGQSTSGMPDREVRQRSAEPR